MKRMIVVEGPDGAGKSTLLEQLSDTFDVAIEHTGGPPKDRGAWCAKMSQVWGFARRAEQGETVLVDRLPQISEQIYSMAPGREIFDSATLLNREAIELGPVVIYCRCSSIEFMWSKISTAPKAHKPSAHLQWVLDNYPRIVAAYDQKIGQLSGLIPIIHYSWPDDTYDNLLEKLKCAAS